jgi:hypothetical protein
MKRLMRPILLGALLAACESSDATSDKSNGAGGNLRLADENNYSAQSGLTIPAIETASAADLEICWTDVVKDLQCHDVAPDEDLDTVALLRFAHLSEAEIAAELTTGQLAQSEVDGYADVVITEFDSTCTKLSEFSFFESEIELEEEYFESDERKYLMLFSKGTNPGVGARSMIFLRPSKSSTNKKVDGPTGCGMLEFSADLASLEPLAVPSEGPWILDWGDVTRDGQGYGIEDVPIDGVLLGFYEGKSVDDLEEQVLDLTLIATESWEIELERGDTVDLSRARGRNGEGAFEGFEREEEGVWLLGLTCSMCQNPAPVVLTILEPEAG